MNILKLFNTVRAKTESICKPLKIEDYVVQPSIFASPAKWHLAHTTWFFEAFILEKYIEDYSVYDKDFSFLFNSYYNNAGDRIFRADRGNITRPDVNEVYLYRTYVDEHIKALIKQNSSQELKDLIVLGMNHEQQHQELLTTDIKCLLGNNPIFPVYKEEANFVDDSNTENGFVKINEGVYEIGYNEDGFCYDNELGKHKVYVNDFEISKALVTNEEFIAFIEDEGYSNFNLWLDEGWSWVQENNIKAPMYWHNINNKWHYFTLSGLQKVNPKAILSHINFYEANAFAEWKQMRLTTEFEWEIASEKLNWGKRWEWTYSAYLPYPNFKKAEGAIGEYNGKFMMNQMVLRGASVATSKNHSRNTYRNFFHAQERWQFTGIRLVK
ncbi:ergothioneine biosynthesis protein EgtB [Polaribacter ponticola]|uniref:Ergothioneine biosynthesis protein EgtB n=1 Tax=Polaribacter ponticola TaxID=2978475 RepID=A0ABT5S7G2_9FLAO|nr:ergothioneine biosynthesis protein EgtB [Polaribacter sp. MSW5]MDD7914036.1 ergothioneine biosynthesis protein EgtB [Polaribacter sp. MSW5]